MKETDILLKTAKGASILSTQNMINTLLGFIFFMFFARMISEAEMGIYGGIYMIYMILSIVGVLGLGDAASRFISYYYGAKNLSKASQTAKRILMIVTMSGLVFGFIQFILANLLSQWLFGSTNYVYLFRIAAFATLSTILAFTLTGLLQGLQRFKRLALIGLSSQIIRVIISIALLSIGFGVAAAFIGFAILYTTFTMLALIVAMSLLKDGKTVEKNNNHTSFKFLLKFSMPMMFFYLIIYLSDSVDRFIVLNLLGIESLGVYTVALTGIMSLILILTRPLQETLIPGMSEIYAKAGTEKVSSSLKISIRYISMILIPTSIGIAVLAPLAINILAGPKYSEAILPFSIISIGVAIFGFSTAIISAMTALKETLRVALAVLLASIAQVGLTFLLVSHLGILGAAISRVLMYIMLLVLLFLFSFKILKIAIDFLFTLKTIIASVIMAFVLIFSISYLGYHLVLAPLYVILGIVIFWTVFASMHGLRLDDIQFIAMIFPGGKRLLHILSKIIRKSPLLFSVATSILQS